MDLAGGAVAREQVCLAPRLREPDAQDFEQLAASALRERDVAEMIEKEGLS